MKLVSFMKKLDLTEEQEEKIVRLVTKKVWIITHSDRALRITRDGWVYPVGYPELSQHWDKLTEPMFWKEDLK